MLKDSINFVQVAVVIIASFIGSLAINVIIGSPIILIFNSCLVIFTIFNLLKLFANFINSDLIQRKNQIKFDHLMKFQVASFTFYLISLFSSSFIEEEHQLWYFFELTQVILIIIDYIRILSNKQKENNLVKMLVYLTAVLAVIRLLRSINQTGNKWINQDDIGDFLRE